MLAFCRNVTNLQIKPQLPYNKLSSHSLDHLVPIIFSISKINVWKGMSLLVFSVAVIFWAFSRSINEFSIKFLQKIFFNLNGYVLYWTRCKFFDFAEQTFIMHGCKVILIGAWSKWWQFIPFVISVKDVKFHYNKDG